ncbi:hypothetical protein BHE74_00019298 [Ensete ventricosum]|nr:hypothetical protein BHE74_00019298 [Ensete ventricosum]
MKSAAQLPPLQSLLVEGSSPSSSSLSEEKKYLPLLCWQSCLGCQPFLSPLQPPLPRAPLPPLLLLSSLPNPLLQHPLPSLPTPTIATAVAALVGHNRCRLLRPPSPPSRLQPTSPATLLSLATAYHALPPLPSHLPICCLYFLLLAVSHWLLALAACRCYQRRPCCNHYPRFLFLSRDQRRHSLSQSLSPLLNRSHNSKGSPPTTTLNLLCHYRIFLFHRHRYILCFLRRRPAAQPCRRHPLPPAAHFLFSSPIATETHYCSRASAATVVVDGSSSSNNCFPSSFAVARSFRISCLALPLHMVGKFVSFLSIGGRSPISLAVEVLLLSTTASLPNRRRSSSSPPLRNRRCPLHYRKSYLSSHRCWTLPHPLMSLHPVTFSSISNRTILLSP